MQPWEYCRLFTEKAAGSNVMIGFQRFDKKPEEIARTTYTSQPEPLINFYARIAALGEDGWELVYVYPDGTHLFKRPLNQR